MKKITFAKALVLVLSLCLCCLASAVLSSCTKTQKIDLAEYKIVYSTELSSTTFKPKVESFLNALNEKTGASLALDTDRVAEKPCEILIGETNRIESAEVLAGIQGDGYAICKKGDKIVIVGTSRIMTVLALDVFLNECSVPDGGSAKLSVPKNTVVSNTEMIEIDEKFVVVYSSALDDAKGNSHNSSSANNPNDYDYPVQAAYDLRANLAGTLGKKTTDLQIMGDGVMLKFDKEIVVGSTNRDASQMMVSQMDANICCVAVRDGKIVVSATNDAGLKTAVALFKTLTDVCRTTNGDGKTVVRFPADLTWFATYNSTWYTAFPRPEGEDLQLSLTKDVADGSVAFYYTGGSANAATFTKYVEQLKAAGYRVREENSIGQSLFATLVNHQGVLHVSYAAFEYASEQNVKLFEPTIRIVSAKLSKVNLIPEEELTPDQDYTKVTQSKITTMRLSYKSDHSVYGNSYVFTLEDGSMVVYDGGMEIQTDIRRLYNLLRDLHYQSFGEFPTASRPLTVAAWVLSHGHGDHYSSFLSLCEDFGSYIVVEKLLSNFTSDEEDYNSYNPNNYVRDQIGRVQNLTQKGMTYVKIHTGQKFYLRNMEIEVLYTHEDLGKVRIDYFNDSTTVIRTTFYNTDGKGNREGVPTSALWLGDLYLNGSKCLRAMYGSYLKSDMVQLAHHGYQGCELALYQLVAPTCVWWPSSEAFFYVTTDVTSGYWAYRVNAAVANQLSSVKYIIIQDGYNTTVTMTKDGADYRLQSESETGLYNAGLTEMGNSENEYNPIVHYGGCIIKR